MGSVFEKFDGCVPLLFVLEELIGGFLLGIQNWIGFVWRKHPFWLLAIRGILLLFLTRLLRF